MSRPCAHLWRQHHDLARHQGTCGLPWPIGVSLMATRAQSVRLISGLVTTGPQVSNASAGECLQVRLVASWWVVGILVDAAFLPREVFRWLLDIPPFMPSCLRGMRMKSRGGLWQHQTKCSEASWDLPSKLRSLVLVSWQLPGF